MNVPPGETVAIQGLGGLGHLAIQCANRFGYRVVAISRDSKKEKFARALGAHEYIDTSKEDVSKALRRLGKASMIVLTAPNADVVNPLLNGLEARGKLLMLSELQNINCMVETFPLARANDAFGKNSHKN
ncbi:cinnamyl alcohol dehydrogenase [Coccidioides immitis RMSCC 3703]|uniref:Cinnamyl alcohol dehydrogenase n=1 Tax=Coccidioides immitis RMSCC 3703 TaxID=454286 RepID=A0A0J8TE15_COCIT|nr:cinnamyl alcohol dehydrogenase [Coccidioides immitis RMSCC 3703]